MVLDDVGVLQCTTSASVPEQGEETSVSALHPSFSRDQSPAAIHIVSRRPWHPRIEWSYHNHPQFTLRQIRQFDLLDCDSFPSIPIQRPIHRPKCTPAQAVTQLLHDINPLAFSARGRGGRGEGEPSPYIILELRNILGRRFCTSVLPGFLLSFIRASIQSP